MKILHFTCFWGCVLLASVLSAQDQNPFYASNPGKPIWGPQVNFSSLKGKVVFIEYWGLNCGPCIAAFPKLVECQSHYAPTGKFVMIGSHRQSLSPEVPMLLQSKMCNFTVYQQYVCPLPEAKSSGGIPFSILIDHTGKVVAKGHPLEVIPKVEYFVAEAKKAPLGIFGPTQFSPCEGLDLGEDFQGLAKHFPPDKSWTKTIKKLEDMGKPKGKNPGNSKAQELHEQIMTAIEARVEEILEMREDRPVQAMMLLAQIEKNVSGLPMNQQVKEALTELRKDKEVTNFQKLWNEAAKMLRAKAGGIPPQKQAAAKKAAGNLYQRMKKLCESGECSPAIAAEAKSLMKLLKSEFTQERSSLESSLSSVEL